MNPNAQMSELLTCPFSLLTYEELGVAVKIQSHMWVNGAGQCSMRDDDEFIARLLVISVEHWKKLRSGLQSGPYPIFEEKDRMLISPYLRSEAARLRKYRKAQSENGIRSGVSRRNQRSTVVHTVDQPGHEPALNLLNETKQTKRIKGIKKTQQVSAPTVEVGLTFESIIEHWNAIIGVHPVSVSKIVKGAGVHKRVMSRMKEHPAIAWWVELFEMVRSSSFLTGQKTDFRATLDWVLLPENLAKVIQGNYVDQATNNGANRRETVVGKLLREISEGETREHIENTRQRL